MRMKVSLPTVAIFLILTAGCQSHTPEGQSQAPPATPAPATAPQTAPPATAAATPPAPTAAPSPAPPAAPAAPPAGALASQQSNWPGIAVDITEFRRKGSTLTAKMVLRNQGSAESEPDVHYNEIYVMDLAAGKKYEVLKDEKDNYIAALRSGYRDRWYQKLKPGESYTLWMKFPAPPADVKTVTLQIPGLPPFEDLAIQDS